MNNQGHHVIIGAGAIGRATAQTLVREGHSVVVATRTGTDLGIPGALSTAVDATNPADLAAVARDGATIVNAANPSKYNQWERDWPPLAAAMLDAAERSGAGLVTVSNLYGYGEVSGPMTEETPLNPSGPKGSVRVAMWNDALAAHEQGRIQATELRASDYFGPGEGASVSLLNRFVIAPAIKGKPVRLIAGVSDAKHSWTYGPDIGTLAATLATDARSWGRAWHVPSAEPRTMQEVAMDVNRLAGTGSKRSQVKPHPWIVKKMARLSPIVRELDETDHQFERSFILDSSLAQSTFGLAPTPWETALKETIAAVR